MTGDDIIRMSREAGMPPVEITSDKPVLYPVPDALQRFASLVAAAEREACAQVADANASIEGIAQRIAAAVRARGQA